MLFAYIDYRLKAKNLHGVHSPFVYELVEKVIRGVRALRKSDIELLRRELCADKTRLALKDYGAGSRMTFNTRRSISQLARHSASRPQDAAFLQRLSSHMGAERILELGTNLGLTTAYLSAAAQQPEVYSIEGDATLAALARQHLSSLHLEATVVTGSFTDALPAVLNKMRKVDLAYIDGHHELEATKTYVEALLPYIHEHSVIAIGDIHWSTGMNQAWKSLMTYQKVTVSIDLFYMGLLFFHRGQASEHFTLLYP